MDEEVLNQQVRRFLKRTGINAQREIEGAVREAVAAGRLTGDERLAASMTLRVPGLDLEVRIDGEIALE
jgi:hypothetical protein